MRVSWMIALAFCLGSLLMPQAFAQQGGGGTGGGTVGQWHVDNGGQQHIVNQPNVSKTYRIHNNGDDVVTVVRRDHQNHLSGEFTIQPGTDSDIGVEAGGSLTVKDSTGSAGASGTFTTV